MSQLPTPRYVMTMLIFMGTILSLLVGACSSESQEPKRTGIITLTPLVVQQTELPETDTFIFPTPSPANSQPVTENPPSMPERLQAPVRYQIDAMLDWNTHTVDVVESVTFRNEMDRALNEIVFNVETNREDGFFVLNEIVVRPGKRITGYMLAGSRLTVPLPSPLLVDSEVTLILNYTLHIPPIGNGYNDGHLGYWGYSTYQVNLGMWFPLVAAFDDLQIWAVPETHWLGEHFMLRAADFAVELRVMNAPVGLRVAGPGQISHPDDYTWRFELADAREVAISLSEQFDTLHTSTDKGVAVDLFYLPDPDATSLDTPRHALHTATDAMMLYEDLFGSYPYERLVVVEGDFPDGMEFSGLVFVSKDWFHAWQGDPNDWLTIITAHEVAHQWWYASVGNDQAHFPYLDEALAIYSEVLFFERYYPEFLDWWWEFRVMDYEPVGYVDTPIYDFYSVRGYIDAVYLRGARMMAKLRTDIGDMRFFDWLRAYATRNAGEIATPLDLWGLLPSDAYDRTETTRASYLSQPDVLPPRDFIP